jgi:hypothetical protein
LIGCLPHRSRGDYATRFRFPISARWNG